MQNEMKFCTCQFCEKSGKSLVRYENAHASTEIMAKANEMNGFQFYKWFQSQVCMKDFTSKATLGNHNSLAHENSCNSSQDGYVNFNQNHGTDLVHKMKDHPMTLQVVKKAELDPIKGLEIIESPNHPAVWTAKSAIRVESRSKVRGFKQPTLDGFVDKKNFQSKQRQENDKPEYVCSICKTVFTCSLSLFRHKSTHLGDPKFHCKICSVKFNSTKALRYHTSQVHESSAGSSKYQLSGRPGKNTKKPLIDIECHQSKDPIYVRQSFMEDPQLWPKVVMSRDLNDILMSHK